MKASYIVGAMALAICILCPLVDLFDQWDAALQTGHDTEYPLVALALCVGLAFALARFVIALPPNVSLSGLGYGLEASGKSSAVWIPFVTTSPTSGSPPLSLRI